MKSLLIATTALIGIAAAQNACASSATATIAVTASVPATCTVTTPGVSLSFGTLVSGAAPATSVSITVNCSAGAPLVVALSGGNNAVGAQNYMNGQTNVLSMLKYNLYQDAGCTIPWGSTVGTNTLAVLATGPGQLLTVCAKVPSQPSAAFDLIGYTDTVQLSITY